MFDFNNMTRSDYLFIRAWDKSQNMFLAREAVATTALEHPEWDLEETKSYKEWLIDDKEKV